MRFTFHKFNLGDVDDVEIYAALPIGEWLKTPKGQWVEKHATDLKFYTQPDHLHWGYQCVICGNLDGAKATEYVLKWQINES